MEYAEKFEADFMDRKLVLLKEYKGPSDATLLLNCLLGLLIVPKETSISKIPEDRLDKLAKWGLSSATSIQFGKDSVGRSHPETIRQLVWSLRNAVAHFHIVPCARNGECKGFCFSDRSGFNASIDLDEIRNFVAALAKHLSSG